MCKSMIKINFKKKELVFFNKTYCFNQPVLYSKNNDLISVIIPVYNAEESIRTCLRSVLDQSYTNIEVIIVYLDGTDRTLDIINSFNDHRIKIVNQLTKSGPGGARNIGLDNVSGKYVGFIEADDYIPYDFYETLHKELVINKADLSICEIIIPREHDTDIYFTKISENKTCKSLKTKLSTMTNGAAFNKLFKNSIIQKHKIRFTEYYRYEDNPWLLKVLYYSKKVALTNLVKYYYCCNCEKRTEQYLNFLKQSIPPIAKEMIDFSEMNHFSKKQKDLVGKIIMISFVRECIQDESIYLNLKKIIGDDFFYKHANEFKTEFGFLFVTNKSISRKFKNFLFSKKNSGGYIIFRILGIRIKLKRDT